ncbi:MAG TPA: TadE/TadG family type IV pilus assembly protein, partial [Acidimicrobiia bacterium]|nr:TadE/TadG family type IV pilus assembly protein [Acidimicrobiia bacterium]
MAPDRKPERGAAVVETAFITIFLLILVTGIIDVGRAIFTNISIQEAAQEAAVYAAFDESVTVADIAQRAVDSTSSPALNVGDVQVSCVPVPKSVKNGSRVSVTVSYSLDP